MHKQVIKARQAKKVRVEKAEFDYTLSKLLKTAPVKRDQIVGKRERRSHGDRS